jgi:hypothetical protein
LLDADTVLEDRTACPGAGADAQTVLELWAACPGAGADTQTVLDDGAPRVEVGADLGDALVHRLLVAHGRFPGALLVERDAPRFPSRLESIIDRFESQSRC